jgi:Flp pilus assembly pilin Flp
MFNRFIVRLKNIIRDETGPTAVEYAVLLSLIVVFCIGSVRRLSDVTGESFDASAKAIDSATK